MRSFALTIGILLAVMVGHSNAEDRPVNVVLIYADDLGYGDLACYGHPKFRTPRLDRMAAEGARLANFYSTCPYCAPSRASLMTGRYPFRNGLMPSNPHPATDYGNTNTSADNLGLPDNELTLGEMFQQAGYATTCIGKWHLGHKPRFYPTRNGFDEYFGILYSNDMHPVELWDNETMIEYPVVQETLTKRYTQRAVDFIHANRNRPFFLYLPHAMPHKPLAASEDFYTQTGTGLYGDAVTELDWSVGRILDALKEFELDEQTLVLFSSDNGPWYGGSTGGLRGMKGQWWEGGIRVPLIARWPGVIPEGHVSDAPAIILDLFATALTSADIRLPADRIIDGRDIMPVLTGRRKSPHHALFSFQSGVKSVLLDGWKLHIRVPPPDPRPNDWVDPRAPDGETILAPMEQYGPSDFPGVKTGDRPEQHALFNLHDDPAEQNDLAEKHPGRVTAMLALIRQAEEQRGKKIGQGKPIGANY